MLLELCSNNVSTTWLYCTFNQKLSREFLQLKSNIFSHQINFHFVSYNKSIVVDVRIAEKKKEINGT